MGEPAGHREPRIDEFAGHRGGGRRTRVRQGTVTVKERKLLRFILFMLKKVYRTTAYHRLGSEG